ncbi:MAG: S8 family serine peptidase, partial [Atopobiaceae bacterium]|nr:S8 family serine peptidase [Atopobiaceae bacterium]
MTQNHPRMTSLSRMRLVFAAFLSLVLVLSGVPMPAVASSEPAEDSTVTTDVSSTTSDASDTAAASTSDSESDKATQISDLLATGDYVEGEVVAAVYGDAASTTDWFATEGDSSDTETLLDTTASSYATATDEAVSAQSTDDTISVILITNPDMTCEQMLDALWDDSRVLMVEPNYVEQAGEDTADEVDTTSVDAAAELAAQDAVSSASSTSSDTATVQATSVPDLTSYQWGLDNDGSTLNDGKSYLGFDINSPNWPDGDENAAGVVAVMDSGIDYTNPDLDDVVIDNMRSYNLDGGDYGMNVSGVGDATDVMDTLGHGTHCAGVIASEWNDFGTSGVANGVKLTAVKVYNADGALTTASMARGYAYLSKCVDNGLNLVAVNNSWGDRQITRMTSLIVTQLGEKGVVSIFSAGNEEDDTDYNPRLASALKDNPYAVVVGATGKNGEVAYNFGQSTTDVMAPGAQILSTAILEGTSEPERASSLAETDGN